MNGRLQSDNPDGGLWVAGDRFMGGFDTNKIGFWNGSTWQLAVLPNGNIGIGGNTNPGYPLHLPPGKALRIDGGVNSNDGAAYLSLGGNGAFSIDSPNVSGGRFVVSNSGAVGIGTPNPSAKLTISADDTHLQLRREASAPAGTKIFLELFQDDSPSAVYPCLRFHHSNRFWHRIEGNPDGLAFKAGDPGDQTLRNVYAGTAVLNALQVGANGTVSIDAPNVSGGRFMVTNSGNVGIGTPNPGAKLTVAGTAALDALQIGNVTIGEKELTILQKLAAGTLRFDLMNVQYNEYAVADSSTGFGGLNMHRAIFAYGIPGAKLDSGRWQITDAS